MVMESAEGDMKELYIFLQQTQDGDELYST